MRIKSPPAPTGPSWRALVGALAGAVLLASPVVAAGPLQPTGEELWVDRYDPENAAAGLEVLAAPDGAAVYAVGGTSGSDDASFYRVVAFDPATGDELWSAERPANPHAAALSSDGSRIYLATTVRTDETYHDWNVIALDTADGEELWSTVFAQRGRRDHPNDVAVSADGRQVHVVGRAMESRRASHDIAVLTLDATTGEERWSDLYSGPAGRYDEATGVAVDPEGDALYVTGYVTRKKSEKYGDSDTRYTTVAYGLLRGGNVRLYDWAAWHNGPGRKPSFDLAHAVATDGETVYVTGQSASEDGDPDWLTIAHDADDGSELWTARYNRRPDSEDAPYSMALGPGGGADIRDGVVVDS